MTGLSSHGPILKHLPKPSHTSTPTFQLSCAPCTPSAAHVVACNHPSGGMQSPNSPHKQAAAAGTVLSRSEVTKH
eukprot:scaffold285763_cov15-Tisochrysis_lutea.AAC.3